MPGLNLGLGGGLDLGGQGSTSGRQVTPSATIAQTAYGAGSSPTTSSRWGWSHIGAVVVPSICVVGLIVLRWSLPK